MDVAGVENEWAQTPSLRGEYVDSDQAEMVGGLQNGYMHSKQPVSTTRDTVKTGHCHRNGPS